MKGSKQTKGRKCKIDEYDLPLVVRSNWSTSLLSDPESEVSAVAAAIGARLEWQEEEKAKAVVGPQPGIRVFKGERKVWFNSIVGMHENSPTIYGRGSAGAWTSVMFEDGSEVPAEVVEACASFQQEICVAFRWRQGDVLILDNLATMHGRRPCNCPRRVLVSLFK